MEGEFCEWCGCEVEETDNGAWCPDCQLFVMAISDEDLVADPDMYDL